MKDCKKYQNYIDMYFDEGLGESQKKELSNHFELCKECKSSFIEIESLAKRLNSLEKIKVPPGIASSIMTTIHDMPEELSWKENVNNIFLSPFAIRLNLASVTVLLLFLIVRPYISNDTKTVTDKEISITNQATIENTKVRFYLSLPLNFNNIETVSVVGDFNGWDVNSFKLQYKSDGIWEGVFPIKPGKYEYMFVINGEKWIPDPKAREYKEDGFGGKNSILVL
ncbi:MAG: isoamylase early set domain-containing protein [Candidatus Firestonebacteria bacterium]|nr:isoamylase early set domain-containing protein [Candidatus Firestonebacteria bacterium]